MGLLAGCRLGAVDCGRVEAEPHGLGDEPDFADPIGQWGGGVLGQDLRPLSPFERHIANARDLISPVLVPTLHVISAHAGADELET